MTSGAAIRQGFRLARRARSGVWVLLLSNLALAALAGLPIYSGILRFTGFSLMTQTLASGFPPDWLTDFSFNNPGSLDRYAAFIALLGLLSIPVNSILAGGVVARFRAPEQSYSLGHFFFDTRHYAARLLRLMVIGLVCYWVIFRVINQGLGNFVDHRTRDTLDDRPVFWLRLGVDALVLLGIGFVNLVMDFARVKLVMDEGESAVEAFLASLGFSLARLGKATVVYAVPSLCGIVLLGLYRLVAPWQAVNASLGASGGATYREPLVLALLFLGQQAVVFGRYWFRVATWASEWSCLRNS